MTKRKIITIYLFMFLIPYIICLALVGTSFNSLVIHSNSIWRTIVGSIIGALFLMATKVIIQRSIQVIQSKTTHKFAKSLVGIFDISKSPFNLYFNFISDFALSGVSTYLIRKLFTPEVYMGSLIGYLVAILVISLLIGSNVGFEILQNRE
ncbi:hypothetical protein RD055328_10260 [Companilactobacillus sp. RD055328]|uniref:hypothetical protein n=1 Tax=Companilactobacillus sp. RD055328 TaxID=2916634 RepID=UPI001FC83B10|nr:hypothetical protein [Companilactobacillus sp. RD055328]GKQ43103.1 hypothetical protein RD055328_10260 [Companilactobacillus sp. RD055328]